jgi:hypothetical protein
VSVGPPLTDDAEMARAVLDRVVFGGEFDPDTPREWGRGLLAGLSKAYDVEMRGRSHGAAFNPCGALITTEFLRAPGSPPSVGRALTRDTRFGRPLRVS